MASFHMDGDALVWFQDSDETGMFATWEGFVDSLLTRRAFGFQGILRPCFSVAFSFVFFFFLFCPHLFNLGDKIYCYKQYMYCSYTVHILFIY